MKFLEQIHDTIDLLEDRDLFYQLLDNLEIPHIQGDIANNERNRQIAVLDRLVFRYLIRPSYVIGGKGMEELTMRKS